MAQIRKDFLLDRYSIISETRGKRPHQFKTETKEDKKTCYFCPGFEEFTPPTIDAYPKDGDWKIRVFRNKFPALKKPEGEHEIIVETRKHRQELEELHPPEILEVFNMYEKRRKALEKKFKYVSIFKNAGKEAGASFAHSHTQILASNQVPTIASQENKASKDYFEKTGHCAWCDETRGVEKARIAIDTKNTIAMTANAPRFPYEIWLMPKRHVGNFSDLNSEEALDFCSVLKKVLMKLSKEFGPCYNFVVHHSPHKWGHFHLEILPRVATHAGYELGEGSYIITVSPETAAKFYRS